MRGFFILFFIFFMSFCEGMFYISSENSTWQSYTNVCNLATPKVRAGSDMHYYLTERHGIQFPATENVWVGYYQVDRVFEYVGCVSMQDILNYEQPPSVEIIGYPGHCFPSCGDHTLIGMTKAKCYCLGLDINLTNRTRQRCTDSCNNPTVSCGKDYLSPQNAYLSIYKMNLNVTASTYLAYSQENDCLSMVASDDKTFNWDKCSTPLSYMCANEHRVMYKAETLTWIDAAKSCLNNGHFPTKYSNSKDVNQQNGNKLWTGMFKTKVVYKYNLTVHDERRHDSKQYGYLTIGSDGRVELKFSEADSSQLLLCDSGANTRTDKSSRSTKTSTSNEPITTTSNHQLFSTKQMNDESKLEEYIIIGSLGSVVLLSLVTVLLVCYFGKRRKNKNKVPVDQNNKTQLNKKDRDNLPITEPNNILESNNCFVLKTIEDQKDIDGEIEVYDAATVDMTYNTTKYIAGYGKVSTDNLYNQLQGDTTYDHAITGIKSNQKDKMGNEMDETYDKSTEIIRTKSNDRLANIIYNQCEDNEENEYHHLGQIRTNTETDNVYSLPEEQ